MKFIAKKFSELSTEEVYIIIRLRIQVFSVEMNCAYQDLDDKDLEALHCMMMDEDNDLVGYVRVLQPGVNYPEASLTRVIIDKKVRGTGVGTVLVDKSLKALYENYGKKAVKISALTPVIPFYEKLGFEVVGEEFFIEGFSHKKMILE